MPFNVKVATLAVHAEGYDHVEDAMNAAALVVKDSPEAIAVVVDTEDNDTLLIIHDGHAYLADAAPALEE